MTRSGVWEAVPREDWSYLPLSDLEVIVEGARDHTGQQSLLPIGPCPSEGHTACSDREHQHPRGFPQYKSISSSGKIQ